jgi:hypothetical protein
MVNRWLLDFFDHLCGHPEHSTAPERCTCEQHRIGRGELVRCATCYALYEANTEHTEHRNASERCGCACGCIPTIYNEGCECGHSECWCSKYQLTQPCSHPSRDYCTNRSCDHEWTYCEECDYYYADPNHAHDHRICGACGGDFDYQSPEQAGSDRYGRSYGGFVCDDCEMVRCYGCMLSRGTCDCANEDSHEDDDTGIDDAGIEDLCMCDDCVRAREEEASEVTIAE